MSESLCFKHNKHHVYSESECPWCEIDRLKAALADARYDRKMALIDEQHLVDAEIELAEARAELTSYKTGVEVEGAIGGYNSIVIGTKSNTTLLGQFEVGQRVRVLVMKKEGKDEF